LSFDIIGRENIPKIGRFIIASNHVSYLDPPFVGVACPRQLNFMAKVDLFRGLFFRWMFWNVNMIPVKRNAVDIASVKEALRRLKGGEGLGLFPEGTRSVDGRVGRAFEGVGFLARKSGAPVVPAYVQGTQKALPKGENKVRRTHVNVFFGPPVDFTKEKDLTDAEITKRIMGCIDQLKQAAPQESL
jgi:1-acyl-sn-glycerol-3-phosphate acyltransferase